MRPGKEPNFFEGALAWAEPRLHASATWRGSAQAICRTLHDSRDGAVVWRCLLPRARAEAVVEGAHLSGLGYAEHLSMTLPPWRLPIDTLQWGRFLSPEHAVIWIGWEGGGSPPKTWVFSDGIEVRGDVSEEAVFFEGGELRLPRRDRLSLRSGRLSSLLRNLPGSLRTSPIGRALSFHETKWRTRACLETPGVRTATGWAIHEVVRLKP